MTDLAIRIRGAVKRYGPITAVDGLDLDVPEGTCVGLLGPNGAGKSTTMRLLTAQSIADEGEIEVLGFRLPEESKAARAQCGVTPQLDNLDVTLTVEQNLLVFAHLYRIGRARAAGRDRAGAQDGEARGPARLARRQALRRHAPAPADRARARPPAAARAPRRADRRPRPAGAPGALGADRRAAQRGDDDPHVDALHRGGPAPRRHGADHVPRQGGRGRPARGARARARRQRGARGLRPAGAAGRGRGRGRRERPADAAHRHERLDPRRRRNGNGIAGIDGERRPANLEDVFVLLTGEEIA